LSYKISVSYYANNTEALIYTNINKIGFVIKLAILHDFKRIHYRVMLSIFEHFYSNLDTNLDNFIPNSNDGWLYPG
jgi:hypothetical protein